MNGDSAVVRSDRSTIRHGSASGLDVLAPRPTIYLSDVPAFICHSMAMIY